MNEIIKQLKQARQERKLKQSELGSKLGLPQSHISKIEKGGTDPRLSTVEDMARLLGQELVLVPRAMLPAIRAILSGEDTQKPKWRLDEEEGG
jgi:transcriptional regulator with XRE-family HTH domain